MAGLCATGAALLVRAPAFPTSEGVAWAVVAGLAEAAYFVTLARSLERAPLGVAYTIARGGAILVVWPLSMLWFGERASLLSFAGSALVLAGLVFTGLRRGGGSGDTRGLLYAVACAVFVSFVYLAYKRALAAGVEQTALFALSLVIALPVNVLALGRGGARRVFGHLRTHPVALACAGIVCAASFLIFLDALRESGTGRVLTLRNTSVIFAQMFGWAMGERPNSLQIGGVVLVAAGAVLLGIT